MICFAKIPVPHPMSATVQSENKISLFCKRLNIFVEYNGLKEAYNSALFVNIWSVFIIKNIQSSIETTIPKLLLERINPLCYNKLN